MKQTFSITEEASRLLAVHAAYLEVDRCEIVDRLIRQNLTRFSVVDRGELA